MSGEKVAGTVNPLMAVITKAELETLRRQASAYISLKEKYETLLNGVVYAGFQYASAISNREQSTQAEMKVALELVEECKKIGYRGNIQIASEYLFATRDT